MDLETHLLRAFLKTHEEGSFTRASEELRISQSALSQKIAKLEDILQATVFIRQPRSLSLTAAGERLLVFAKSQLAQERDFLSQFDQYQDQPAGSFRLAGFSSVMRSMIIPQLAPLMRKNERIQVEFSSHDMHSLEERLKKNKADAILLDYFPNLPGAEEIQIAEEEYVLIESSKHKNIPDIYLDHGPDDNATESFFNYQNMKFTSRRGFMGDVYGILDGVEQGLGKAVMSKHLIENEKKFIIKKTKKRYLRPIVLCFLKQSYYPPIHQTVVKALQKFE